MYDLVSREAYEIRDYYNVVASDIEGVMEIEKRLALSGAVLAGMGLLISKKTKRTGSFMVLLGGGVSIASIISFRKSETEAVRLQAEAEKVNGYIEQTQAEATPIITRK